MHCLKELGLEATKAEELTKDMPEVLRNAIQTGINNANKKAVSNAARVSHYKLLEITNYGPSNVARFNFLTDGRT